MALPAFAYVAAKSVEEGARLAAEKGDKAVVMAGGTDVIPLLKDRVIRPELVIDIKDIPGLGRLEHVPGEGLRVGALVKLHAIESSEVVKREFPAVAEAAHYVASKQIRCKGTMAGNICNASPSADTASILLAMGATVWAKDAAGEERAIPIDEFFKGVKKTCLAKGELVTRIDIPETKPGEGAAYFKLAVRKAMDLAIIGVAAWVRVEGGVFADARIAVGGAATTPFRARAAEAALRGKAFDEDMLEEAAKAAAGECRAISDVRASAEYRTDMVRVFTKRAVRKALERLKG